MDLAEECQMLYWETIEPEGIVDVGSMQPARHYSASCSSYWVAQYLDWVSPIAELRTRTDPPVAKTRKSVKKRSEASARWDRRGEPARDEYRDFDYAEGGVEPARGWGAY